MQSSITQYLEAADKPTIEPIGNDDEVFSDCISAPNSSDDSSVTALTTDTAVKRPRPDSGPFSLKLSPQSKKVIYDGEEAVYTFEDDPPFWVPMIFKIMDKVHMNVCEMKESFDKVQEIQKSFDEYKETTDIKIRNLETAAHEYKSETDQKIAKLEQALVDNKSHSDDATRELEKSVKFMDANIELMNQSKEAFHVNFQRQFSVMDDQEQYSRRNCLVLHGIPETAKEKTDDIVIDTVNSKLGLSLSTSDLDRSHRIGRLQKNARQPQRPRAIIVKFARYNTRAAVFRQKKKLKGTKIMLTESLTSYRIATLKKAKDYYGAHNVWTSDGEILTKVNDKVVNVTK